VSVHKHDNIRYLQINKTHIYIPTNYSIILYFKSYASGIQVRYLRDINKIIKNVLI